MKTIMRFIVRAILIVMAVILIMPFFLIFNEGESFIPNILGLIYAGAFTLLYNVEDKESGLLHGFLELYKIAFKKTWNYFKDC